MPRPKTPVPRAADRVEDFLAAASPALRPVLAAARTVLDDGLPDASRSIKWNVPCWTGKRNVAALMPHGDRVNLQFFRGADLPDPRRLLHGDGPAMRHVRLTASKDLKDPAVKALVRHAWRLDQQ